MQQHSDFCYLAPTPDEGQYHRIVTPYDVGFPLSLATFGSDNGRYSFVRGAVVGIPTDFPFDDPANFWFDYSIVDSNGHITNGRIFYQRHQSANLPEFTFVAHRGVFYTIVGTFSLVGGVQLSRCVMLAPIVEDEDFQEEDNDNQIISTTSNDDDDDNRYQSLAERFDHIRENILRHNHRVNSSHDNNGDDSDEYYGESAEYPGDSIPDPNVTIEQLDRDLDRMVSDRNLWCLTEGQQSSDFDQSAWNQWWVARWNQLDDEEYEAAQAERELVRGYVATYGSSQEKQEQISEEQISEERQNCIDALEEVLTELNGSPTFRPSPHHNLDWRNPDDRAELIRLYPSFYGEKARSENQKTTAAARAACLVELSNQW